MVTPEIVNNDIEQAVNEEDGYAYLPYGIVERMFDDWVKFCSILKL